MKNKIELFLNTIIYLKPSQVYYRLLHKLIRQLYARKLLSVKIPDNLQGVDENSYLIPELDFNQEYLDRFNREDIENDRFSFINITNTINFATAWNDPELQHLWRYNLHYFEYLYILADEYSKGENQEKCYNKYKYFVENWISNNPIAIGDGWHPYTISLRLTNWIVTYQVFKDRIMMDGAFHNKFLESMYQQYQYLQKNLEQDVLGNHYFENIKGLILGSIFFNDIKGKEKYKRALLNQLKEQILADGMHFELSPMYHKIILEDLIKITYWLKNDSIYNQLISYIGKMIDIAYSLEENFGKTPSFNDSTDGISKDYQSLVKVCKEYFGLIPQFRNSFENSGFYVFSDQHKKIIFDTGDICPRYLPAHGHCDALSMELSWNNRPMMVNSGTYRYESGKWRDFFRSTSAHNTVSIAGKEQSQVWGRFRVAKRIRKIARKQFDYNNIKFYAGTYISYTGDEHKRFIGYVEEDKIIVLDYIKSNSKENIKSFLHFIPGAMINVHGGTADIALNSENIRIIAIGTSCLEMDKSWYSDAFNRKEENNVLVFEKDNQNKVFGYLIDFGHSEMIESANGLEMNNTKKFVINYDELGDML